MKREELKALELNEEQISEVLDLHHAELDPVSRNLEKVKDDLKTAQDKVTATEAALKKFEGTDPDKLQEELQKLRNEMERKDAEHAQEIADRDFDALVNDCIRAARGVNPKAITALLDVETLKASKNQRTDVEAAIKELMTKDDSKMLFGEPESKPVGTGKLIGEVQRSMNSTHEAAMREVMGLAPVNEQQ